MPVLEDLNNIKSIIGEIVVPVGYEPIRRTYTSPTEKSVTTDELPCFLITWSSPEKIELMTFGGSYKSTRQYNINFLYKPVGQGTIADNLPVIMEYRSPTIAAFLSHLSLYGTTLGQYPVSCTLPIELPIQWGGTKYVGFTLTITVIEQTDITFGS